jgi:2-iminobutanoate/2-iminopropanoate deaminase
MGQNAAFSDNQSNVNNQSSKVIRVGKLLFLSHELPVDKNTGELIKDDFKKAAKVCMDNLCAVMEAEGVKLENIISTTVYIQNEENKSTLDEIISSYFSGKPPVKNIVEGNLHGDFPLKIDAVAIVR